MTRVAVTIASALHRNPPMKNSRSEDEEKTEGKGQESIRREGRLGEGGQQSENNVAATADNNLLFCSEAATRSANLNETVVAMKSPESSESSSAPSEEVVSSTLSTRTVDNYNEILALDSTAENTNTSFAPTSTRSATLTAGSTATKGCDDDDAAFSVPYDAPPNSGGVVDADDYSASMTVSIMTGVPKEVSDGVPLHISPLDEEIKLNLNEDDDLATRKSARGVGLEVKALPNDYSKSITVFAITTMTASSMSPGVTAASNARSSEAEANADSAATLSSITGVDNHANGVVDGCVDGCVVLDSHDVDVVEKNGTIVATPPRVQPNNTEQVVMPGAYRVYHCPPPEAESFQTPRSFIPATVTPNPNVNNEVADVEINITEAYTVDEILPSATVVKTILGVEQKRFKQ